MLYHYRSKRRPAFLLLVLLALLAAQPLFAQCPEGFQEQIPVGESTVYAYPSVRGAPSIGQTVWPYCVESPSDSDLASVSFTVPACTQATEAGTWSGSALYPTRHPGEGNPRYGYDTATAITGVHFDETISGGSIARYYVALNGDYLSNAISMATLAEDDVLSASISGPDSTCRQRIILPVELTVFDVVSSSEHIQLTWETASEQNNAGFIIESAVDDGEYHQAGFVEGYGTTIMPNDYSFELPVSRPGDYTLRLGQVDFDGKTTWLKTVEVTVELADGYFVGNAYPNPFNPQTSIDLKVRTTQIVRAEIYNPAGRLVKVLLDRELYADEYLSLSVNLDNGPSGLYLLRISGEHFSTTRKLSLVK